MTESLSPTSLGKKLGRRQLPIAVGAVALLGFLIAIAIWARRPAPIKIAFANSMTGVASGAGTESLVATQLYLDEVNRDGGVNGHPVELVVFDDASSGDTARANAQKIAESDCIAVLGHYLSAASLAASPGYQAAHIPALTGTSLVDHLTLENPYYFRAQTTNFALGRSIAEYIRQVWHNPRVEFISPDDLFGVSFRAGFVYGYEGAPFNIREIELAPEVRQASMQAAVEAVANDTQPGIIVIGASAEYIREVLKALRRRGVAATVVTTAGAGSEGFFAAVYQRT